MIEKAFFDGLSNREVLIHLSLFHSQEIPIYRRCSKREFDDYWEQSSKAIHNILSADPCSPDYAELIDNLPSKHCRRVPIWNNGGGVLDQISDREPDAYYYEKLVGYENVIMIGSEMAKYLRERGIDINTKLII